MADATEPGIVVRGEATVRRVPDIAVVNLAVTVQDKDAGRARDEANRRASAILDRLRGNPRVHIAHNADDPLTARQSILDLRRALGDQVTVFPHGGHLGNLWYPDNKELMLRILGANSDAGRERARVR